MQSDILDRGFVKIPIKIGIIGKGFVGSAVNYGFSCDPNYKADIKIYDKNPALSTHSIKETVNSSNIIFLSVPTPANIDGSIDIRIVDSVLSEINRCQESDSIILLRSTLIPGTTQFFSEKFPKLKLVFNPEFLTERNAKKDFINQSRIILGGDKKNTNSVAELYNWRFQDKVPIIQTNFQTAELIKYMNNTFLATKISFMNEMKMIGDKINVNWDKTVEGFIGDIRVGSSHVNVPGNDGKLGFSGSCFPKDLQAIIHFAESIDVDTKVLKGAWETNLKVRPEKDWEKLEGQAMAKKDN
jgi:UDPglucose 6-dehydrogenase